MALGSPVVRLRASARPINRAVHRLGCFSLHDRQLSADFFEKDGDAFHDREVRALD
jgi:hypothetical protein